MAQAEARQSYAAQRARLLLGCYRTGDANDPETYVAAVSATLAHYPDEIITQVTHPVSGLPSSQKWLPSVSEVRMACEEAMGPYDRIREHKERIAQQLADREHFEQERERAKHRPTLDDMKAKYGDTWGIGVQIAKQKAAEPAPSIDQLHHHYQHYDLAFKPKTRAAE